MWAANLFCCRFNKFSMIKSFSVVELISTKSGTRTWGRELRARARKAKIVPCIFLSCAIVLVFRSDQGWRHAFVARSPREPRGWQEYQLVNCRVPYVTLYDSFSKEHYPSRYPSVGRHSDCHRYRILINQTNHSSISLFHISRSVKFPFSKRSF